MCSPAAQRIVQRVCAFARIAFVLVVIVPWYNAKDAGVRMVIYVSCARSNQLGFMQTCSDTATLVPNLHSVNVAIPTGHLQPASRSGNAVCVLEKICGASSIAANWKY